MAAAHPFTTHSITLHTYNESDRPPAPNVTLSCVFNMNRLGIKLLDPKGHNVRIQEWIVEYILRQKPTSIGIQCTHGLHRSVDMAMAVARDLERLGWMVSVIHWAVPEH